MLLDGTLADLDAKRRSQQAGRDSSTESWPEPTLLPDDLPPVPEFDYELLPTLLRRRVEDISQRMQCPADFPAVTMMVMLSAVVGRRCAVQPKRQDDWIVVPNLWGMVIGRPGIMKTPAIEFRSPSNCWTICSPTLFAT